MADYVIFCLGATSPSRCLRACKNVFSLRAAFFLAFLLFIYFSFLLFLPFFAFDFDVVCLILSFSGGYYYAVSSVSISAATHSACDVYLIHTHADFTVLFLSEVYDLFQLLRILPAVFIVFLVG